MRYEFRMLSGGVCCETDEPNHLCDRCRELRTAELRAAMNDPWSEVDRQTRVAADVLRGSAGTDAWTDVLARRTGVLLPEPAQYDASWHQDDEPSYAALRAGGRPMATNEYETRPAGGTNPPPPPDPWSRGDREVHLLAAAANGRASSDAWTRALLQKQVAKTTAAGVRP